MANKSTAVSRLRRQLKALEMLRPRRDDDDDDFSRWLRATRVAVERTFGDDSKQTKEFNGIYFYPPIVTEKTTHEDRQCWHEDGLREAKRLLEGFIEEINDYWEDSGGADGPETSEGTTLAQVRLFISHRSTDKDLAKAMADLLRTATSLRHAMRSVAQVLTDIVCRAGQIRLLNCAVRY